MSTQEISAMTGLSEMRVDIISRSLSWEDIDVPSYRSFCQACGMDMLDPKQMARQTIYLLGKLKNGQRRPPQFEYLKKDPLWESYYQPLMARYVESIKRKVVAT